MNRIRLLFILVLGFLIMAPASSLLGQIAKIKTQYKSQGNLGAYTAGTFPIYSGNHTVAKWMKVYLTADTSTGASSFIWSIVSSPTGSTAALSSTSSKDVTFTPDNSGQYIISLATGSTIDIDTFWVSTYTGPTNGVPNCSQCHNSTYTSWSQTGHANIFKQGITGQLETENVNNQLVGVYNTSCIKCHTTGWDQKANNGNYGYLAHQNGFDTTWYKTYTLSSGEYLIPTNDQTAWNLLNTASYSNAMPVANIGCESCHGPGTDHVASFGNTSKISATLDAGVCLQCHEAPTHHMVGTYYNASNHATMPLAGTHATSTSCFPCHSGSAYFKYSQNQTSPGYSTADASQPISCSVCHDPHDSTNYGLRLVPVTLKNGYTVTTSGNGQLCMTCHQSRKNIATTITSKAPYYGFSDRFGPHHGPQADMLLGQNAFQYGDSTITGMNTHASLQDGCVTCHMQARTYNTNHQMSMSDSTGDYVTVCKSCHGSKITSFDDIKASADWDGNGKIEGVQTEVQGMLNKLAALLPKDSAGAVVSLMADSLKVKNQPNIVKGIYTYYFVSEDKSMGVHNAKYTAAILQKALDALGSPTAVNNRVTNVPQGFSLSQNYPNPFNPSTTIQFTLPYASNVKITLYNITGAVVKVLLNSTQSAGVHQTIMNSNSLGMNLSSGIYFYSIQAVSVDGSHAFKETKKMILLK